MFSTGNGVPPTSGVQLINNLNPAGPLRDLFSQSPSSLKQDFNLDGAVCLRNLIAGTNIAANALQTGVNETRRTGRLNGKPVIIVHGRADALLPVNHTSRAYAALTGSLEGSSSRLRYIEVTNAQHFDSFIGLPAVLPGYDTRYIPRGPLLPLQAGGPARPARPARPPRTIQPVLLAQPVRQPARQPVRRPVLRQPARPGDRPRAGPGCATTLTRLRPAQQAPAGRAESTTSRIRSSARRPERRGCWQRTQGSRC